MINSLIGKIVECPEGKIGLVTDVRESPWGTLYVGCAINGELWMSNGPVIIIADFLDEYLRGCAYGQKN